MSGYRGRSFRVEYDCPQCGGPVELDETDRFLSCGYCRARLYILSRGYLRYYLPPSRHPLRDTIFVPYWRFRGMYFSARPFEIRSKVLDTSFLSSDADFLPVSMGLRTQALKLKFASPAMTSRYMVSSSGLDDVVLRVERTSRVVESFTYTGRVYHSAFVGETASMIYSPVYVKNRAIYDGVLDRPIANLTQLREEKLTQFARKKGWRINFVPALCPDCGWDLAGARDSIVLLCRNCDTAWSPVRGAFRKVEFRVAPFRGTQAVFIPFWKMEISFRGIDLHSVADLMKLANLPRALKPGLEGKKAHFWSPAFRGHPRVFMRLARQMTILQPDGEYKDAFPRAPFLPVTLDSGEAVESVKVTLASIAVAKRKFFPRLPDIGVSPKSVVLMFFPFQLRGTELISADFRFSIQKNTMRGMENLIKL